VESVDLLKEWKHLYKPSAKEVALVEVPAIHYLMVDGEGDPNTAQAYQQAIEALFTLSYTLKFQCKKGPRQIDYKVMPLESLWWADDLRAFTRSSKDQWKWTAMIAQPEFVSAEDIAAGIVEVQRKKKDVDLSHVRFETFSEGASAQILFVGPFADEGPTIERLHAAIAAAGKTPRGKHHEIYLSDARRTAPEKLKTILRQPCA